MMKVAYILDAFPKISETFILNEMVELQRQGVTVEVFAFYNPKEGLCHRQTEEIKRVNYFQNEALFEIIVSHVWFLFHRPLGYAKVIWFSIRCRNDFFRLFVTQLKNVRLIELSCPNHIQAHFGHRAADMAMMTHLLTGIPFTFSLLGYDIFVCPPRNIKIKCALAKGVTTITNFNRSYIVKQFGVSSEKISVIRCGVDLTKNVIKGVSSENIILSVARFEYVKGVDVLVKACSLLKKAGVQFKCLIVGDGSQYEILKELIKDFDLEDEVKLLGYKTQDQVYELLSKARIKVLSSRSESLGVALIEAMAMRVPVIGPAVNGVSELIKDGESGFLVPPDREDLLAEKINLLLENEGLRSGFAGAAYKTIVEEYNLEIEVGKLINLFY
ncbi:MAG: glycosyltransferase family 4 protein [Candidatus Omnitrophica bacterium]|nr:glycosyltransferase family 4 protein [Candidatus Omnitrophota bacterium]